MGTAPEIKPSPPRQKPYITSLVQAALYASHKSLTFNGISDWAVNYNLFGTSTFPIRRFNRVSVSFWVKSEKNDASRPQVIVSRWFPFNSLPIDEGGWRWMIWSQAVGASPLVTRALHFHLCTNLFQGIWLYSRASFPLDTWVHVEMTYSGSGVVSGLKMYWDGSEVPIYVGIDNWTTSALNSNQYSHLLWGTQYTAWDPLGANPDWPPILTYFFEGKIDECAFWRYTLDDTESEALYNGGYPVSPLHVGLKNGKPVDRYFRMGEHTDGTPWVAPGSSIGWDRMPLSPPATLSNMFWNNDGATPPLRVSEDVAP